MEGRQNNILFALIGVTHPDGADLRRLPRRVVGIQIMIKSLLRRIRLRRRLIKGDLPQRLRPPVLQLAHHVNKLR
jgi:hypothetical protein